MAKPAKSRLRRVLLLLKTIASSNRFFVAILVLFALQALWAASSLLYPIAFDENYHLGIIQIYSQQLSPFIAVQPENSSHLGQLTHLPSFLYHYLMSFPYRLLSMFTHDQTTIIVGLRLLNIALFVGGLVLYRTFLLRLGAAKYLTHIAIALTTFVPSVMLLAAGINYDNLLFLLTPLFLLASLHLARGIRTQRKVSFVWLVIFAAVGALASIVKYPFLPIVAGASLALFGLWLARPRRMRLLGTVVTSFRAVRLRWRVALLLLLFVSLGLFGYRYGTNVATYGSIDPACPKVLSVEACSSYGPWIRDHLSLMEIEQNGTVITPDIVYFEFEWFSGIIHRLYFAINHDYYNLGPLPLAAWTVSIVLVASIGCLLLFWRRLHRQLPYLWIVAIAALVYTASLQLVNFSAYARLGELVAVNGRYFIPLLPLIVVVSLLGFMALFERVGRRHAPLLKAVFLLAVSAVILSTCGLMTYLFYSDASWYWPNSPLVNANGWLQQTLAPFMLGEKL